MGERLLRGAVAGLAGAAVAAARRAKASAPGGEQLENGRPPGPPPRETEAPPVEDPRSDTAWYFAIGKEKKGPVSTEELGRLLTAGTIGRETLVWRAGMESWMQASEVDELSRWMPRRPPDLPVPERQWFYAVGEQQVGPVAETDLRSWLSSGQLPREILVWRKGLDQWRPASSVPELRG